MSIPEKCGHGVHLRGPNPPRCIGCEIVWAEQVLFLAERQVKEQKKRLEDLRVEAATTQPVPEQSIPAPAPVTERRSFNMGDRVTKTKGSSWTGRVVGFYSTSLTPIGYAVESENEPGSVQIYPEAALTGAPEQISLDPKEAGK